MKPFIIGLLLALLHVTFAGTTPNRSPVRVIDVDRLAKNGKVVTTDTNESSGDLKSIRQDGVITSRFVRNGVPGSAINSAIEAGKRGKVAAGSGRLVTNPIRIVNDGKGVTINGVRTAGGNGQDKKYLAGNTAHALSFGSKVVNAPITTTSKRTSGTRPAGGSRVITTGSRNLGGDRIITTGRRSGAPGDVVVSPTRGLGVKYGAVRNDGGVRKRRWRGAPRYGRPVTFPKPQPKQAIYPPLPPLNRNNNNQASSLDQLKKIFGTHNDNETRQRLFELTGYRDENVALKFIENLTGIKDRIVIYDFLKKCKGFTKDWSAVIRIMTALEGSANIKGFVNLLRLFTNQTNVFKAFATLEKMTGHSNFDAIYKVMETLSLNAKSEREILDYFRGLSSHGNGIDGVKTIINKWTGGLGPAEFPALYKALAKEVDLKASMNLLISATRTTDIGEAVLLFNRICGKSRISKNIETFKRVTGQKQFRYGVEELTHSCNKLSLKDAFDSLFRITGTRDIDQVNLKLRQVFNFNNIVTVIQKISQLDKNVDALTFMESLLEVTRTRNIVDATSAIRRLTTDKALSNYQVLVMIRDQSGHGDIVDFFRKLEDITNTKSIQDAWSVMVKIFKIRDIFVLFARIRLYTHTEVILFMESLLRITNSNNIGFAVAKLNRVCNSDDIFVSVKSLHDVAQVDVVVFLESFITLSKRFDFEDAISIVEKYTNTTDLLDALKLLRKKTGKTDMIQALEYVKHHTRKETTTPGPVKETTDTNGAVTKQKESKSETTGSKAEVKRSEVNLKLENENFENGEEQKSKSLDSKPKVSSTGIEVSDDDDYDDDSDESDENETDDAEKFEKSYESDKFLDEVDDPQTATATSPIGASGINMEDKLELLKRSNIKMLVDIATKGQVTTGSELKAKKITNKNQGQTAADTTEVEKEMGKSDGTLDTESKTGKGFNNDESKERDVKKNIPQKKADSKIVTISSDKKSDSEVPSETTVSKNIESISKTNNVKGPSPNPKDASLLTATVTKEAKPNTNQVRSNEKKPVDSKKDFMSNQKTEGEDVKSSSPASKIENSKNGAKEPVADQKQTEVTSISKTNSPLSGSDTINKVLTTRAGNKPPKSNTILEKEVGNKPLSKIMVKKQSDGETPDELKDDQPNAGKKSEVTETSVQKSPANNLIKKSEPVKNENESSPKSKFIFITHTSPPPQSNTQNNRYNTAQENNIDTFTPKSNNTPISHKYIKHLGRTDKITKNQIKTNDYIISTNTDKRKHDKTLHTHSHLINEEVGQGYVKKQNGKEEAKIENQSFEPDTERHKNRKQITSIRDLTTDKKSDIHSKNERRGSNYQLKSEKGKDDMNLSLGVKKMKYGSSGEHINGNRKPNNLSHEKTRHNIDTQGKASTTNVLDSHDSLRESKKLTNVGPTEFMEPKIDAKVTKGRRSFSEQKLSKKSTINGGKRFEKENKVLANDPSLHNKKTKNQKIYSIEEVNSQNNIANKSHQLITSEPYNENRQNQSSCCAIGNSHLDEQKPKSHHSEHQQHNTEQIPKTPQTTKTKDSYKIKGSQNNNQHNIQNHLQSKTHSQSPSGTFRVNHNAKPLYKHYTKHDINKFISPAEKNTGEESMKTKSEAKQGTTKDGSKLMTTEDTSKPLASVDGSKKEVSDDESTTVEKENVSMPGPTEKGSKAVATETGAKTVVYENGSKKGVTNTGSNPEAAEEGYKPVTSKDGAKTVVTENEARPGATKEGSKSVVSQDGFKTGAKETNSKPLASKEESPVFETAETTSLKPNRGSKPGASDDRSETVVTENGSNSVATEKNSETVVKKGGSTSTETLDESNLQASEDESKTVAQEKRSKPITLKDTSKTMVTENGFKPTITESGTNSEVTNEGSMPVATETKAQSGAIEEESKPVVTKTGSTKTVDRSRPMALEVMSKPEASKDESKTATTNNESKTVALEKGSTPITFKDRSKTTVTENGFKPMITESGTNSEVTPNNKSKTVALEKGSKPITFKDSSETTVTENRLKPVITKSGTNPEVTPNNKSKTVALEKGSKPITFKDSSETTATENGFKPMIAESGTNSEVTNAGSMPVATETRAQSGAIEKESKPVVTKTGSIKTVDGSRPMALEVMSKPEASKDESKTATTNNESKTVALEKGSTPITFKDRSKTTVTENETNPEVTTDRLVAKETTLIKTVDGSKPVATENKSKAEASDEESKTVGTNNGSKAVATEDDAKTLATSKPLNDSKNMVSESGLKPVVTVNGVKPLIREEGSKPVAKKEESEPLVTNAESKSAETEAGAESMVPKVGSKQEAIKDGSMPGAKDKGSKTVGIKTGAKTVQAAETEAIPIITKERSKAVVSDDGSMPGATENTPETEVSEDMSKPISTTIESESKKTKFMHEPAAKEALFKTMDTKSGPTKLTIKSQSENAGPSTVVTNTNSKPLVTEKGSNSVPNMPGYKTLTIKSETDPHVRDADHKKTVVTTLKGKLTPQSGSSNIETGVGSKLAFESKNAATDAKSKSISTASDSKKIVSTLLPTKSRPESVPSDHRTSSDAKTKTVSTESSSTPSATSAGATTVSTETGSSPIVKESRLKSLVTKGSRPLATKLLEAASGPQPRAPGSVPHPAEQSVDDSTRRGGKLSKQSSHQEISHALQANLNFKILILPTKDGNKNCFCTCDSQTAPKLISLDDLPPQKNTSALLHKIRKK